jgi:hypothetical protein
VDLGFLDLQKNAGGMLWSSRGKLMMSCRPSPPWIRINAIIALGPPISARVMCGLRVDAAIIIMRLFDLATMMELMQRHRITVTLLMLPGLMPPIVVAVVKMTDDQAWHVVDQDGHVRGRAHGEGHPRHRALLRCLQTVVICMHCLCWRCLFGRELISTVDRRQTFFRLSKMHGIVGVSLMAEHLFHSCHSLSAVHCVLLAQLPTHLAATPHDLHSPHPTPTCLQFKLFFTNTVEAAT